MKYLLISFLLSSCTTSPTPTTSPVTAPSPATMLKADWPKPEWTIILSQALTDFGPSLLKGEYAGVCGEKRQFWVMLLSAITRYESGFNPNSKYTEKFPDSKGNLQVSAGLFQLSLDDAKVYDCDFKTTADTFDVTKNIRCAVRAMNKLVDRDGVIAAGSTSSDAKGAARYWSVMRSGHHYGEIMAKAKQTCL